MRWREAADREAAEVFLPVVREVPEVFPLRRAAEADFRLAASEVQVARVEASVVAEDRMEVMAPEFTLEAVTDR